MLITSGDNPIKTNTFKQQRMQPGSNLLHTSQEIKPDLFQKSCTPKNAMPFGQAVTSSSEMNRAISYEIFKQIKKADSIALHIHKNPDSDCLGAAIMMKQALDGIFKGTKKVRIFSEPISEELRAAHQIPNDLISQSDEEGLFDLGIALDCASSEIMYNNDSFQKCKYKINIDHHKTNTNLSGKKFADLFLVDPEYISTTQLLYEEFFNKDYGYKRKFPLGKDSIEQAAIGLEVDRLATNNWEHPLANQTVRDWIQKYRIDMKNIWERVKSQLKLSAVETQLYGSILSKTNVKDGIAYTVIKDANTQDANIERIIIKTIDTLMEIKDVKSAIIFYQKGDIIKVNLRGKNVDVGEVARKFGGGGHKSASGFIMRGENDINKLVKNVLKEAERNRFDI